ncbi:MAG: DUF1360 domain-containing protein [Paludibacteraceae bacterium]|nr:DUF1360 domain-containing protein [Paludibacteraceae bacterium]
MANMVVYARGPFGIFERWRDFSHSISDGFGELFTCMMCLSTWIGLILNVVNVIFVPFAFTPACTVFGLSDYHLLSAIVDMGFTSGVVWLLHQLDEMMERIWNPEYEDGGNG